MRLGVFGGSFDPVHYGHLLLAESCREQFALDEVWFVPAAVPPHKQARALAPAAARVEMLELATAGHEQFRVCRYEVDRGGVSFTVDTLAHLQSEDAARELFLLLGADSLAELATWREPGRICALSTPLVVCRPGQPTPDWSALAGVVPAERLALLAAFRGEMPEIGISSTELRRRVAAGSSIRYRTPRAVELYVQTHGLYGAAAATTSPA